MVCVPFRLPGQPSKLRLSATMHDVSLSWSKPEDDGGKPIITYIVRIATEQTQIHQTNVTEGTQTTISGIPEGGPYIATIAAQNELGFGPELISEEFNISISHCHVCSVELESAPDKCTDCSLDTGPECMTIDGYCTPCWEERKQTRPAAVHVNLVPRNTDDLIVSWQAPEPKEGFVVTGYVVRCIEDETIVVTTGSAGSATGARLHPRYCLSCGAENVADTNFCIQCGEVHPIISERPSETGNNSTTIQGLTIGNSYSFTVSAVTEADGEGPPSNPSATIKLSGQQLHPMVANLNPGEICTIAGNGTAGYTGDGLNALNASLDQPYDVAVDELGNIYIADSGNNVIRKVSADTGIITTEVGTGMAGFSGDKGSPANATLNKPRALDFDAQGNLYIADRNNNRVRKVNASSTSIETLVGNGQTGSKGDGTKAIEAQLEPPEALCVDKSTGTVYVTGPTSGFGSKRVRMVNKNGIVSTFAGSDKGAVKPQEADYSAATDILFSINDDLFAAADFEGSVYIGDQNSKRLYKVDCASRMVDVFNFQIGGNPVELQPQGLAYSPFSRSLFINDGGSVTGGSKRIQKLDLDRMTLLHIAGDGKLGFLGDSGHAVSARFNKPRGMGTDSYGNLYIADTGNQRVRVIRQP